MKWSNYFQIFVKVVFVNFYGRHYSRLLFAVETSWQRVLLIMSSFHRNWPPWSRKNCNLHNSSYSWKLFLIWCWHQNKRIKILHQQTFYKLSHSLYTEYTISSYIFLVLVANRIGNETSKHSWPTDFYLLAEKCQNFSYLNWELSYLQMTIWLYFTSFCTILVHIFHLNRSFSKNSINSNLKELMP